MAETQELRVYNTMTQQKEIFKSVVDGKVYMYVCGVTAYHLSHIGHARAAVSFDLFYRYLQHLSYEVTYVRNFTDVDDKERSVVWMANGNRLVNGRGSGISVQRDGTMIRRDANGSTVWETNTASTDVDGAELLDGGNLVLNDPRGKILGKASVPDQILATSTKPISIIRRGDFFLWSL